MEFHEMREEFHEISFILMKPSSHCYQVYSLANCAMKLCIEIGLRSRFATF